MNYDPAKETVMTNVRMIAMLIILLSATFISALSRVRFQPGG
jgi:hypothetical protein